MSKAPRMIIALVVLAAIGVGIAVVPTLYYVAAGPSEPRRADYLDKSGLASETDPDLTSLGSNEVFKNEEDGFEFKVPPEEGWGYFQSLATTSKNNLARTLCLEYKSSRPLLCMIVSELSSEVALKDLVSGFGSKEITINGNIGYKFVVGGDYKQVATVFSRKNVIFYWVYDLEPKEMNSLYDGIISTFKLTK